MRGSERQKKKQTWKEQMGTWMLKDSFLILPSDPFSAIYFCLPKLMSIVKEIHTLRGKRKIVLINLELPLSGRINLPYLWRQEQDPVHGVLFRGKGTAV